MDIYSSEKVDKTKEKEILSNKANHEFSDDIDDFNFEISNDTKFSSRLLITFSFFIIAIFLLDIRNITVLGVDINNINLKSLAILAFIIILTYLLLLLINIKNNFYDLNYKTCLLIDKIKIIKSERSILSSEIIKLSTKFNKLKGNIKEQVKIDKKIYYLKEIFFISEKKENKQYILLDNAILKFYVVNVLYPFTVSMIAIYSLNEYLFSKTVHISIIAFITCLLFLIILKTKKEHNKYDLGISQNDENKRYRSTINKIIKDNNLIATREIKHNPFVDKVVTIKTK